MFAYTLGVLSSGLATRPYHPTFLFRCNPADDLAVLEVGEHSVLFFVGVVHQLEVMKDDTVDEVIPISFAISSVPPPPLVRPTTMWYLVNTALAWRRVKQSGAGGWTIVCPYDYEVCELGK